MCHLPHVQARRHARTTVLYRPKRRRPIYFEHMDREQEIPFVYENGVLKPEGPVDFPEGTRGIAHIRELPVAPDDKARRRAIDAIRRIGESGVFNSGGRKLTRDQMHERS